MASSYSELFIEVQPTPATDQYIRSPSTAFAQPRTLSTRLTNEEFETLGLQVLDNSPGVYERVGNVVAFRSRTPVAEEWLIKASVEANQGEVAQPPNWLHLFQERIDELRSLAVEENVKVNENSFGDALKFAASLTRVKQPSIYLIGNGNIRFLWLAQNQEQVGIQFRGGSLVQYVLFKNRQERLVSIMGEDVSGEILGTIAALKLKHVMVG